LGQKQTFAVQKGMSALPPIADIDRRLADVRFVPIADIAAMFRRASNWSSCGAYFVIGIRGSIVFTAKDRIRRYRVLRRIFRRPRDSARKINYRRFHDFNSR